LFSEPQETSSSTESLWRG